MTGYRLGPLTFCLFALLSIGWQEPRATFDKFNVKELFPTTRSGRQWYADWSQQRMVPAYKMDSRDPLFKNGEGVLSIADGVATAPPGRTRLIVLTPKDEMGKFQTDPWRNVEMTVYVRCGDPTQPASGQSLDLAARSGERHNNDAPCEGTSYHASLRFDGKCGFKKEVWHTGGYSDLLPDPAPKPWPTVPRGQWIGIKFICRNCDRNQHVQLELYTDLHEQNDWRLIAEVKDRGGWEGQEAACDRPKDFILSDAYPVVYFRTDFVPVEVKNFSVREIDPLP